MTDQYGGSVAPPTGENTGSTADTAKEQAAGVKDHAVDAASSVASTAQDQAAGVVQTARDQVSDVLGKARDEAGQQASQQQSRLAAGLKSAGDDFAGMADKSDSTGVAASLVQQAADRAGAAGRWLEQREPREVFDEVRHYARRRPGTFIAIAAVAGIVVGRLTRSIATNAADKSDANDATTGSPTNFAPTGTTVPTTGFETVPATDTFSDRPFEGANTFATTDTQGAWEDDGVVTEHDETATPLYSTLAEDQNGRRDE